MPRHRARAAALAGLLTLAGVPAWAEVEFSLYGGLQSAPHSGLTVEGDASVPDTDVTAGWDGRSLEMPPYWGLRATWWTSDRTGFGLDFTHSKIYADDETLAETGFDRLEFTDGLNILTVNAWRRWPQAFGPVTPYVGAGIGVAVPHVEVSAGGSETFGYQLTGPAASVIAGASYPISEDWSVFGEYKGTYSMNSADLDGGGTLETDVVTNALNLGVSFSF